jgi:hypothetical protein
MLIASLILSYLEYFSVLTRQEKERLVIELYNQGKTIREISKICHISFRDIGTLVRKASGEKEKDQNTKRLPLSPSSQAYKLFSEGKTPIEVAITLNLSESETTKYHEEYLNLKQMHELKIVYDEIGPDIIQFLELYKQSKEVNMKPEHVVSLLHMSNGFLPLVEQRYRKLLKETDLLESEKKKLKILWSQISLSTKTLDNCKKEIKNLQKEKIRLVTLMNNGRYEKVRQTVEKEVNNSLNKSRDLLKLAVVCVTESIIRDPVKYDFLVNNRHYYSGQHVSSQSNYTNVYRALILGDAEKLFEVLAGNLTSRIINAVI